MRKLLVALAVLAVLLLVADRASAALASRALADELQRSGGLSARPTVDVGGFPFLTQAVGGRYDRIEVRAEDVPAGEVRLAGLEAVLNGVQVPLGDALSGSVAAVPVDRVDARVRLAYDVLARRSGGRRLSVAPAGARVRVTGSVEVLGQTVSATALSRVALDGDVVVVTAESFEVGNGVANAVLSRALGDRFDLRVPVRGLPYGLRVEQVSVEPDGVVVTAAAVDAVLTRP
ncbi:MAG: hypothetical protein JWN08_2926 [Frankiales bacterium]|nr:hypothetical protein [Frankiales bacterium]